MSAAILLFTPIAPAQSLQEQVTLDFGNLVVVGPGSVTITTTSDTRTASSGVIVLGGSVAGRGALTILGPAGSGVQITCPTTVPVLLSGGTASLEPIIENGPLQTIPPSGRLVVHLGGTLTFTGAEGQGMGATDVFVTVDFVP